MARPFDNLRITTDFTLRLCARLRQGGVEIGTQQSAACIDAIVSIRSFDEDALKAIYRITLINRKQDLARLELAYDQLMHDYLAPRRTAGAADEPMAPEPMIVKRRQFSDDRSRPVDQDETARTEGYSMREVDYLKDFRLTPKEQIPAVMEELEKIARKYASIARRKTRRSRRHGAIDLRTSVRDSVRYDGEIVNWRYKRKVPTHSRWVIVADVSGSMEIYSVFLLNFLFVLNENRRMKMEGFVFSTRLEHLAQCFRLHDFQAMLRDVARRFSAWSGGTRIGTAIETLNETYETMVTPKTNVVIISDGWDTGDLPLLDRQMARLHSRAKSITWINPLKGSPLYEPLALGMATAHPYLDRFITGHSLESLAKFAELMEA